MATKIEKLTVEVVPGIGFQAARVLKGKTEVYATSRGERTRAIRAALAGYGLRPVSAPFHLDGVYERTRKTGTVARVEVSVAGG